MELQRLNKKELIKVGKQIFVEYLASSEDFFIGGKLEPCTSQYPTVADMLYKEHLDTIEEDKNRIKMYEEAIEDNKDNPTCVAALKKQLAFLNEELEIFSTTNMKRQKERYAETNSIDYTRNGIRIPLDKKINSFYDDLVLEVLFYDNIAVLEGNYESYKLCRTTEERIDFIKKNTEVTHIGLSYFRSGKHVFTAALLGKLNLNSQRVINEDLILLDSRYSDFKNLKLSDTNELSNNDIKQFFQSKIDLDKEACMKKLAEKFVGNDNYQILRDTSSKENHTVNRSWWGSSLSDLYIRYVCPSTGRVYFNNLNIGNLKISKYFEEGNYETYIDAWWSINNLGADPNQKAMIRC